MCSNKEFTVDDFVAARGRQGVPVLFSLQDTAVQKLERVGEAADKLSVYYNRREMPLTEVYERYVESFIAAVENLSTETFHSLTYGLNNDHEWLLKAAIRDVGTL